MDVFVMSVIEVKKAEFKPQVNSVARDMLTSD